MIVKYICDKCGKEFDNGDDCESHEQYCGITKEQLDFVAYDKYEHAMDFFNDLDFFSSSTYVRFNNRVAFDFYNKRQEYYGLVLIDEDVYVKGHIYYYYDVDDSWIDLTRLCKKITNVCDKLMEQIE